jgi:hypothetical protein
LYKGLQRYFDEVFVISTSNRHVLPTDPIDTSGVKVADARTIDYRTILQKNGRTAVSGEKLKISKTGKTLAKLQSSFPTMKIFGEGNIIYIRNAVRNAVKYIEAHQITHVLSTFPPYADHLIAARLKRRYPSLYWIADFRDLHVDPAQDNLLWRSYQVRMNQKILKGANLVTTVSEGLADHLRALHPNVQVLRNGIRTSAEDSVDPFQKFTIAYTGSMFQDKRRPDTLLDAVRELIGDGILAPDDMDLIYAGKDSAVWWPLVRKASLEAVFTDRGLLSSADARTIQRRSHVNVLLTYSTDQLKGNITGKLYDYLAARRPFLVLINGPRDQEIESLVVETGLGKVVYHGDTADTKSVIREAYSSWKSGDMKHDKHPNLSHFTWEYLLGDFARKNKWKAKAVE